MDPDEFEQYLASLPPEEQQRVLYDLGFSQANAMPGYSFGGPFAPELSPQSYDLSLMSQSPPDIEYGDVQPFGLDEESQFYNILQDKGSASLDPAIAMFAGRGAFAPSSFEPIRTPVGEPIDQVNRRFVEATANSQGGYESFLAKKMLDGFSSSGAINELWKQLIAGTSPDIQNDPQAKAEHDQLMGSLPPATTGDDPFQMSPMVQAQAGDITTPQGRAATFDLEAIQAKADDFFERMTLDQPVGYTDPVTGTQYAGYTEEPSPITAKFAEYGLPTPQESYLDPQWLPAIPAEEAARAQQGVELAQGQVDQAAAIRDLTQANFDELTQAWQDSVGARAVSDALRPGPEPQRSDYHQPYLSPEANAKVEGAYYDAYDAWKAGGGGPQGEPPDLRDFYERMTAGPTGQPTLPQLAAAADDSGDYQEAYDQWKIAADAYADEDTGNPYVISSNGKVIDTYDFGGKASTPDERTAASLLAGTLYQFPQFGGYENVQVGQMGGQDYLDAYEQGLADTEQQWRDAMFRKYEADRQGWSGGYAGAQAVGAALALEQAGRTPLNDILAQRTMSQRSFMPNMSMYGY